MTDLHAALVANHAAIFDGIELCNAARVTMTDDALLTELATLAQRLDLALAASARVLRMEGIR